MAQVTLQHVTKIYPGGVRAVDDFSLHVDQGRLVVLVGPSGCGKSTTLRMVAGLEEISSGTISIGGRVVNDVPPKDRDAAMVFQEHALYPHMTVYDNIAFGLKLRKTPRSEIDARVREAAGILGLDALLDRRPRRLSVGQRQRVAVGRAIVRKPEVFLLDEPLSSVDAKLRVELRVEIRRLHRRLGQTMIYVTHDQTEAMTLGDTIVVMKEGVIQQVAEPGELYDWPANLFVASFIGTPPMNLFRGSLRAEAGRLLFDGSGLSLPLPPSWDPSARRHESRAVVLGLRPHDIHAGESAPKGTAFKDTVPIEATVDLAELVGPETYVYLTRGDHSFVCRVEGPRRYEAGTALTLSLDMSRAHLFDPETERRLI